MTSEPLSAMERFALKSQEAAMKLLTETQLHDLIAAHERAVITALNAYAATLGTQTKRLKDRAADNAEKKFIAALSALSK